jgi:hypothetical protein
MKNMLLLAPLNTISDRRRREGRRFDLARRLLFALLAIMSGANTYRSIARFMRVRLEWFKGASQVKWMMQQPSKNKRHRALA